MSQAIRIKQSVWAGLFLLFPMLGMAQNKYLPEWNGYLQTRISSDFNKNTEFTVRRAKLWIHGEVPHFNRISYKIQVVYRSFKDESFVFQDAYADINLNDHGKLRVGRFVPDFLLQRMEPDFSIPVMERALVVDGLVHNPGYIARETGIAYLFKPVGRPWHIGIGIFNGNTDQPEHNRNNSLLYTARVNRAFSFSERRELILGGSLAYRYINERNLPSIYPAGVSISGNDFRWGLEGRFHLDRFRFQSEYITALINHEKADGYYLIGTLDLRNRFQLTGIAEKYNDLNPATNDNMWFGMGINYRWSDMVKLMTDFKFRNSNSPNNKIADVQLQIFFNSKSVTN